MNFGQLTQLIGGIFGVITIYAGRELLKHDKNLGYVLISIGIVEILADGTFFIMGGYLP